MLTFNILPLCSAINCGNQVKWHYSLHYMLIEFKKTSINCLEMFLADNLSDERYTSGMCRSDGVGN